jgi:hypothetical protein
VCVWRAYHCCRPVSTRQHWALLLQLQLLSLLVLVLLLLLLLCLRTSVQDATCDCRQPALPQRQHTLLTHKSRCCLYLHDTQSLS